MPRGVDSVIESAQRLDGSTIVSAWLSRPRTVFPPAAPQISVRDPDRRVADARSDDAGVDTSQGPFSTAASSPRLLVSSEGGAPAVSVSLEALRRKLEVMDHVSKGELHQQGEGMNGGKIEEEEEMKGNKMDGPVTFLRRFGAHLVRQRTEPVVAEELFSGRLVETSRAAAVFAEGHEAAAGDEKTEPLRFGYGESTAPLCDEPVAMLLPESHGLTGSQLVWRVFKVKMQMDVVTLVLGVLCVILLVYQKYALFPVDRVQAETNKHRQDDFMVFVDGIVFNFLIDVASALVIMRLFGGRLRRACLTLLAVSFVLGLINVSVELFLVTHVLSLLFGILFYPGVWLALAAIVRRRLKVGIMLSIVIPQLVGFSVYLAYSFALPFAWEAMNQDWQRALFRLIVHPLIFELAMFLVRMGMRHMPEAHPSFQYILVIYFQMLSSLYGRMLVSSTESASWTVIMSVVLSVQEVALRLSVGWRDRTLYRWVVAKRRRRNEVVRVADEREELIFRTPRSLRLRGELVTQDQIFEGVGIIAATAALILFPTTVSSTQLTPERVATSFAIQWTIEYITDLLVMLIEVLLGVPVLAAWKHRDGGRPLVHLAVVSLYMFLATRIFSDSFFHPEYGFFVLSSSSVV